MSNLIKLNLQEGWDINSRTNEPKAKDLPIGIFAKNLKKIPNLRFNQLTKKVEVDGKAIESNDLDLLYIDIQEKGWDTYQADNILGFSGDERDYKAAAEILKFFKVKKLNIITNNPEKIEFLKKNKITVNKMIKIKPGLNPHNKKYLETKKIIGKHLLNL